MLPGFRFLFAAIVLSTSVLVFGLGAAALLRAAHEQFASNPSWRAAPEPKFAQQNEREIRREPMSPVLAMLRVEPESAPQKTPDGVAAATAPAEPPAIAPAPDQPEKIAALKPEDSTSPEAAQPEITVPETSMQTEAAPALAEAPAPAEEPKIAAAEPVVVPSSEAAPPASEQASAPAPPDTGSGGAPGGGEGRWRRGAAAGEGGRQT
jgi:hypothetical protein